MKIRNHVSWQAAWISAFSLALLLGGCKASVGPPPSTDPKVEGDHISFVADSPQLQVLKVASAVERESPGHRLTGRIVWDEEHTVRIFSPFAGRVQSIQARTGDSVRAGQVLATVDSPDFGQTQADLHRAQVDFALSEKNLSRQRELLDRGVVAAKDAQSSEADYQRALAELARVRSRAALYGGGAIDQRFPLRTPLAGVVVEKNINPGQEVRPDQLTSNMAALFVVTDPTRLAVQLDASEHDLGHLRPGQTVVLRTPVYPDEVFEARIDSVADFIDPTSRAIKVRAVVDNKARKLKGEMFVTADIRDDAGRTLMIPAASTFLVGTKHYAFIEQAKGQFIRVEVNVGNASAGWTPVKEGIAAGQQVVTSGALLLQQLLDSANGA